MKQAHRAIVTSLALVAALSFVAVGCEEGEDVTVINQSSQVIVVFENDTPGELLQPGVTQKFHIFQFDGALTYKVESFEGRDVLASRTFKWDEIRKEHGITLRVQ